LVLERLADFVDGVVALAQRHDLFLSAALVGLSARPGLGGGEEGRQLIATKGVTEHAKGAGRVAEAASDLGRGELLDEIGAQGLVLALAWGGRFAEEAAAGR
jgi:hypothetical protein